MKRSVSYSNPIYYQFLSYAHEDSERVFSLHEELENVMERYIWIDRDELTSGTEWERSIQLAIQNCYASILVITKLFFTKPFIVRKELPWILERFPPVDPQDARIFPIWLDKVSKDDLLLLSEDIREQAIAMWESVRSYQYLAALDGDYTRLAKELKVSLPNPLVGDRKFVVNWPRSTAFQGRKSVLKSIHHNLQPPGSRIGIHTEITGLAGVGKTQIAVEYAHRYRFHYPAGVFWINGTENWKSQIAEIADLIQLTPADPLAPDRENQMVAAFNTFAHKQEQPALIILDNVEDPRLIENQVIGPAGLTINGLSTNLLITTRISDTPNHFDAVSVPTLEREPEAALAILRHSRSSESEIPDLELICQALGYLPLALALSAAALRKRPELTPSDFLNHLKAKGIDEVARLVRLNHGDLNVPEFYNFAVEAALDWHWEHLKTDEALILLKLIAGFGEAFTIPIPRLQILAGMHNEPSELEQPFSEALIDLLRANLIDRLEEQGVRLHPLVRELIRKNFSNEISDLLNDAAKRLLISYQQPGIIQEQMLNRTFSALVADLRETRISLKSNPISQLLQQLEQLFNWEAPTLASGDWSQNPAFLIQQIRERAHHNNFNEFRDSCDEWLHRYSHFMTEEAWHIPLDSALLSTLVGHEAVIRDVAVINRQRVLSASEDNTAKLWDLNSGTVLRTYTGHSHYLTSIAILKPNMALTASYDTTVQLWDLNSGDCIRTFKHPRPVLALATIDSTQFASGAGDGILRLWDIQSGELVRVFEGHTKQIDALILLDQHSLLTASIDGTLRVWNLNSPQSIHILEGYDMGGHAVIEKVDENHFLSAHTSGKVRMYNWRTGQLIREFNPHNNTPGTIALISTDCVLSAVGYNDMKDTMSLWSIETGEVLRTFVGRLPHSAWVIKAIDENTAISGESDGSLRLWNVNAEKLSSNFKAHTSEVGSVVWTDDVHFLSASQDGTVRVWNAETGTTDKIIHNPTGVITAIDYIPEGKLLLADMGGQLWIFDLESGQPSEKYDGHIPMTLVVRKWLNHYAISGGYDWSIRLTNLENHQVLRVLRGHNGIVNSLEIIKDWRLISASADRTLRLWDLATGKTLRVFAGHRDDVTSVAVLDNEHVISASRDKTLRLWNINTGTEEQQFIGHSGGVNVVVDLSDQQHFVSASSDQTLKLWNRNFKEPIATLHLEEMPTALALRMGNVIAVGDNTGKVRTLRVFIHRP